MSDPTHQPRQDGPSVPRPARTLCEPDGRALDALLSARAEGRDHGPMPPGLGDRTDKLAGLLGLLERNTPADPPKDLIARTMQAVLDQRQRKRFADQVQMLSAPPGSAPGSYTGASNGMGRSLGLDWRQLATAAAVFVIASSLLLPVMERQQSDARRIVGQAHMGTTGQALASYASENLGQMPRRAIKPGELWWDVGQPQPADSRVVRSNSSHLFKLFNEGFVGIEDLICPENEYAQTTPVNKADVDWNGPRAVSFSYQNQYTPDAIRLNDNPHMAVLADRNPLFDVTDNRMVFNPHMSKLAPSRAHRSAGQNVLTADGVVAWKVVPMIDVHDATDADNIWTADGIDFYSGTELPARPGDSFLVP